MTVYDTIFATYLDEPLRRRATVAVVVSAKTILVEDPATANHANRLAWAKTAIKDARDMAERMMWGILSDATVRTNGTNSTDAQVQAAMDACIDTLAGLLA